MCEQCEQFDESLTDGYEQLCWMLDESNQKLDTFHSEFYDPTSAASEELFQGLKLTTKNAFSELVDYIKNNAEALKAEHAQRIDALNNEIHEDMENGEHALVAMGVSPDLLKAMGKH